MKEGFYINKKDGRRSFFSQRTLNMLGSNFLKEWAMEGYKVVVDEEKQDLVVPDEIQEIIAPTIERKTIKELKASLSEMSISELKEYQNDDRVTVRNIVEEELKLRDNDLHSEW